MVRDQRTTKSVSAARCLQFPMIVAVVLVISLSGAQAPDGVNFSPYSMHSLWFHKTLILSSDLFFDYKHHCARNPTFLCALSKRRFNYFQFFTKYISLAAYDQRAMLEEKYNILCRERYSAPVKTGILFDANYEVVAHFVDNELLADKGRSTSPAVSESKFIEDDEKRGEGPDYSDYSQFDDWVIQDVVEKRLEEVEEKMQECLLAEQALLRNRNNAISQPHTEP